jgi:hypothetical protein
MADRLSAPLNEDVTRKARRAWLTERTRNYNVFRLPNSEFLAPLGLAVVRAQLGQRIVQFEIVVQFAP